VFTNNEWKKLLEHITRIYKNGKYKKTVNGLKYSCRILKITIMKNTEKCVTRRGGRCVRLELFR
jgi:hypothetical protein